MSIIAHAQSIDDAKQLIGQNLVTVAARAPLRRVDSDRYTDALYLRALTANIHTTAAAPRALRARGTDQTDSSMQAADALLRRR